MTTENTPSEGPYKIVEVKGTTHPWYRLVGPNGETHHDDFSLRAEAEIELGELTAAFAQGRSASDAEHVREIEELIDYIKKARGSLGYGPLKTKPSTIHRVRDILDEALSKYSAKGEGAQV
jgi:hypothetical protein